MNQTAPTVHNPLPDSQFKRFMLVFHVVFMGTIAFCLFMRWRNQGAVWTIRDTALVGLVVLQCALYLGFLAGSRFWIPSLRWWSAYFIAGFGIWLLERQIEPMLDWVVWAYVGQMFGVLPPRISLPCSVLVFGTWFGLKAGWQAYAALSIWGWVGGLLGAGGICSLGLFLHRLSITSSERAGLIQELEHARRELELARERDAELAVLKERERLARDLHDSLGHGLVTLTVQLEAAQRLCAIDPDRACALLDEMKQLTRTSMEQLRRALAGLRAPGLGDRPLAATLRTLCSETEERGKIRVSCEIPELPEGMTPTLSETAWRVAQEGLANVEKHSNASNASVVVRVEAAGSVDSSPAAANGGPGKEEAKRLVILVADDGVGLPPNAESKPGHYGLRGLRERVEGLGGELTLGTASKGARIEARIPLVA